MGTAMLRRVLTLAAWCSAAAVAAMVTKEDSGDAAAGRITKDAEDAAGRIIVVDDVTGSTTFDFSSFITPFSLSLGSVSISSTQLILAIILAVAAAETATKRDYWAELFGEHQDYDYNPYPSVESAYAVLQDFVKSQAEYASYPPLQESYDSYHAGSSYASLHH